MKLLDALADLAMDTLWWLGVAGFLLLSQVMTCVERDGLRSDVLRCIERGHGAASCRYALADSIELPPVLPLPEGP